MDRAVEEGTGSDCSSKDFATVRERRGVGMMNGRVCMSLVLRGIFAWSGGLARAQEAAPPPGEMMHGGGPGRDLMAPPMGDRVELLGFEGMHGGKVVTGAPFSAVGVSESTQTLADGNHMTRETQTNLCRDIKGRFREQYTLPG